LSQIEGRRPVLEALNAGREIAELLVASGAHASGALAEIRSLASKLDIPIREIPRRELESRAQSRNPQGVIALTRGFAYATVEELLTGAASTGEPALLVALDGITDPQNLGALARSTEAAGGHGMIVPARRSASVTPGAEKASAGALEHLRVARVTNLVRALDAIKRKGVWVVGLDAEAESSVYDLDIATEPICLVVGSEGSGLSRLVEESADQLVRIPLRGRIGSLNASAAGAVALFEIRRRRLA
jgi:23S rRNA (guanosine2251-2'-O)-methyltransferase